MRWRKPDGSFSDVILVDAQDDGSEVELLRAVATKMGIEWGRDDTGWWAAVPTTRGHVTEALPSAGGAPKAWSVWRQDDNGNRFFVSGGHAKEEATAVAARFEARGHKQLYWIEPQSSAP